MPAGAAHHSLHAFGFICAEAAKIAEPGFLHGALETSALPSGIGWICMLPRHAGRNALCAVRLTCQLSCGCEECASSNQGHGQVEPAKFVAQLAIATSYRRLETLRSHLTAEMTSFHAAAALSGKAPKFRRMRQRSSQRPPLCGLTSMRALKVLVDGRISQHEPWSRLLVMDALLSM